MKQQLNEEFIEQIQNWLLNGENTIFLEFVHHVDVDNEIVVYKFTPYTWSSNNE